MIQKIIGYSVATVFLSAALAQTSEMSTSMQAPRATKAQNGITVGVEYSNLTDYSANIKYKSSWSGNSDFNQTRNGGIHTGMGGIRVGYNQIPETGLGFTAGASYVETLSKDKNDLDDGKVYFFVPQANLVMAFTDLLLGYAGGNVSVMGGNRYLNDYYKPGVGLQAGLGLRFSKNFSLNAGYQMLSQRFERDDFDGKSEGTVALGGFHSNVTYTF